MPSRPSTSEPSPFAEAPTFPTTNRPRRSGATGGGRGMTIANYRRSTRTSNTGMRQYGIAEREGDDEASSSGSSDWHASEAGGGDGESSMMAVRSEEGDNNNGSTYSDDSSHLAVGRQRVQTSPPPPPPRNPHPEDMQDPIVRRATAAAAAATRRGSTSKSLNDTSHTSAETDGDGDSSSSTSSPPAFDRMSSRIVGAIAGSVGYETALTKRGATDVAVPELCGDESYWGHHEETDGGGGDDEHYGKQTRWETIGRDGKSQNSLCSKRVVLMSLIFLFSLGAVGAGVGYLLSSRKDSSGSATAAGVRDNDNDNGDDDDDFPISSLEPTYDPSDKIGNQQGFEDEGTDDPTKSPTLSPPASSAFLPTAHEATSTPTSRPTTEAERTHKTFSFVVLGDIPYSEEEAAYLEAQLYQMGIDADGNPSIDDLFAVHVGDIMSGSDSRSNPCHRDEYRFVEEILTKVSPIPIFLQPGDNDWTECEDADEGWRHWKQSFLELDKSWAAHQNLTYSASTSGGLSSAQLARIDVPTVMSPYEFTGMVQRQDKRRENFAFMHERVLFMGINMIYDVYSTSEREGRMEDNKEFVRQQLGLRSDLQLRAVILFGHAWYDDFFDDLREELTVGLGGTPVVYFHGDGHEWYFDDEYYGSDNPFYVMQVDNGAVAPPLKITVYGDDRPYLDEADREDANDELIDGFIGIDRQGGTDQGYHIFIGAGAPFLIALGGNICQPDAPCGMCEGDCDEDDDCADGLVCIQRDEFEPVAGCDDPIVNMEGYDYCARG